MARLVIGVMLLSLIGICQAAAPQPRPGDYLEDGFLAVLRATRSPLAAVTLPGHRPQVIRVRPAGDGLQFVANDNWHEGYTLFTRYPGGRLERGEEARDYPPPLWDSDRHFRFRDPRTDSAWRGYSYVGDADAMVARVALGGRYVESGHHLVVFGADGVVHGLGPDARFALDNDHVVGNKFDYFYLGNDRRRAIAFRHRGKRLILYAIHPAAPDSPDFGEPDFAHALRVLDPAP
jgi:hypothetical protein